MFEWLAPIVVVHEQENVVKITDLPCRGKNVSLFLPFRWEHIIYQFSGHDQLIEKVIKRGEIVVERGKPF